MDDRKMSNQHCSTELTHVGERMEESEGDKSGMDAADTRLRESEEKHRLLAERVRERTAELEAANRALRAQIAESERAKAALVESEGKLSRVMENLPDFVIVVDRQARLLYANRAAPGMPVESLLGSDGFSHICEEDVSRCRSALESVFRTDRVEKLVMNSVYGEHLEGRLVPLGPGGEVTSVMIICTDITERKRADEKVAREQELLKKLFDLNERERKLLSHEIHDGFVQDVVGAKMLLESALARLALPAGLTPAELEDARTLLAKAVAEARRMISELRPMIIDEHGIVESIHYLLAEEDARHGIEVDFHHDVSFDRLDPILEGTVFRIVQEAFNNARRHSKSPRVRIRLTQRGDILFLEIRDDGVGFDPKCVQPDRFGLRGIRERTRLFGGEATIESAPGEGTRVHVELPLLSGSARPEFRKG